MPWFESDYYNPYTPDILEVEETNPFRLPRVFTGIGGSVEQESESVPTGEVSLSHRLPTRAGPPVKNDLRDLVGGIPLARSSWTKSLLVGSAGTFELPETVERVPYRDGVGIGPYQTDPYEVCYTRTDGIPAGRLAVWTQVRAVSNAQLPVRHVFRLSVGDFSLEYRPETGVLVLVDAGTDLVEYSLPGHTTDQWYRFALLVCPAGNDLILRALWDEGDPSGEWTDIPTLEALLRAAPSTPAAPARTGAVSFSALSEYSNPHGHYFAVASLVVERGPVRRHWSVVESSDVNLSGARLAVQSSAWASGSFLSLRPGADDSGLLAAGREIELHVASNYRTPSVPPVAGNTFEEVRAARFADCSVAARQDIDSARWDYYPQTFPRRRPGGAWEVVLAFRGAVGLALPVRVPDAYNSSWPYPGYTLLLISDEAGETGGHELVAGPSGAHAGLVAANRSGRPPVYALEATGAAVDYAVPAVWSLSEDRYRNGVRDATGLYLLRARYLPQSGGRNVLLLLDQATSDDPGSPVWERRGSFYHRGQAAGSAVRPYLDPGLPALLVLPVVGTAYVDAVVVRQGRAAS